MEPRPPPSPPRLWLLLPVGAALVGLGLALALNFAVRERHRARPSAKAVEAAPAAVAEARLADTLLTDSILSIVQSYYVDQDRVDNRGLLATALASLTTNPRVKAGTSPGAAWLEVDGERRIFPIKEKPRYQDVLEIFATLARLVDDAGVALAGGETPEKHPPGSVALLNSMLAELDAHSALLSPEAYKELRQGTEGSFGGLGVLVGIRDNLLTVIKPLPRSPAQRAGIKRHDRILGIDGLFTYGYSLDELVEYMRGDPGTDVNLSLLRAGAHAPSEIVLKREVIHVDSVSAQELDRAGLKVLRLTIENFASRTSREVLSAIKKFRVKHGVMHGLVLDLRANPGGLLDQAVQVADLFLQEGVIVTTKGRREEVESADSGFDEVSFPVTVLIDGDSASASEIVAGALQDHGRALVIGQPSFGKGSVQTIFELPGERALKLTIARYYTPHGRSIQNVGIIPDLWLQPVADSPANQNLFGPYRYKNERFLRNHLDADPSQAHGAVRHAMRKAYYLGEPPEQEDEGHTTDRELDLALRIFEKMKTTYAGRPPEGTDRATHWLGLAGPAIAAEMDRLDRELVGWLARRHGVDWRAPGRAVANPAVALDLDEATSQEVVAGRDLEVHWHLRNLEPTPLSRVSLFVRSDAPGFETKEVLLGALAAGTTASGTLVVPVPSAWEEGPLQLRIGAAVDAWPSPRGVADFLVQVRGRPVAALAAAAELTDEIGGKVAGALEGRERARVRVRITNSGPVAATGVHVSLVNLGGSQVTLADAEADVPAIAPGATAEVFAALTAAKTLYTPELGLGLLVESADLRVPLRQRFTVKSRPNAEVSVKETLPTSH